MKNQVASQNLIIKKSINNDQKQTKFEQNNITIANYDGPFDLLLALVKAKKISLLEINVIEIANEYLKIVKS